MRVRLVVQDAASSNLKSERCILQERNSSRGDDWIGLQIQCQVRKTAGVFKKVFALVNETISGQINWALSINHGTGLR
eukprot:8481486-Pyramimonas_sp.AAC.1